MTHAAHATGVAMKNGAGAVVLPQAAPVAVISMRHAALRALRVVAGGTDALNGAAEVALHSRYFVACKRYASCSFVA